MKYSYNWLKSITGTPKGIQEMAEMVSSKGFEFEGKEDLAQKFEKIVVAQVLKKEKHPQADRLWLVKVDDGKRKERLFVEPIILKLAIKFLWRFPEQFCRLVKLKLTSEK